ncbi:low molecular weight protein arginine phosphatase [Bacillus sp. RG28]|uniref:Low molecular weight protein arginine phosphatase n=1 Tax=Gottfriedia endophytica TaxID=2820819 RepID=A0A940NM37_9BACI|nr:low molecular weight protein arginine phosphatase [Gottfriedia endophytica]MBP0725046.1 low molecular weight protein arginine phosphatase [Gottfriedia endophytica]
MKKILFVCTGNTCRSPIAEALLKHYSKGEFEVKSAGVFAMDGSKASFNALEALRKKGIEHEHKSQLLTNDLVEWATHVLTMTKGHKQVILSQLETAKDKVFTLYEFVNNEDKDISDPYGGSLQTYEMTLEELDILISKMVE